MGSGGPACLPSFGFGCASTCLRVMAQATSVTRRPFQAGVSLAQRRRAVGRLANQMGWPAGENPRVWYCCHAACRGVGSGRSGGCGSVAGGSGKMRVTPSSSSTPRKRDAGSNPTAVATHCTCARLRPGMRASRAPQRARVDNWLGERPQRRRRSAMPAKGRRSRSATMRPPLVADSPGTRCRPQRMASACSRRVGQMLATTQGARMRMPRRRASSR